MVAGSLEVTDRNLLFHDRIENSAVGMRVKQIWPDILKLSGDPDDEPDLNSLVQVEP